MAYIDPGTGSILLQLLAASLLALSFTARRSWSAIRDFLRKALRASKD